jgi:hypothetical protein
MLKDKRGLSAIVLTVIMVGLVLVAVGIVWVVVSGILTTQTEALDYNQRCVGLNFEIGTPDCVGETCSLVIERATGSKGDPIDGFEVTVTDEVNSKKQDFKEDIAATKTAVVDLDGVLLEDSVKASVRIYFIKEDETKHYCTQIFESEESEAEEGGLI